MASKPLAVTYDAATNLTTMTVGYTPFDYMDAILLITPSSTAPPFKSINDLAFFNRNLTKQSDDIGYWTNIQNGTGNTFTLIGDWTSYTDSMVIGYNYLFDITLPINDTQLFCITILFLIYIFPPICGKLSEK